MSSSSSKIQKKLRSAKEILRQLNQKTQQEKSVNYIQVIINVSNPKNHYTKPIKILMKKSAKIISLVEYLRDKGFNIKQNIQNQYNSKQSLQLFQNGKLIGKLESPIQQLDVDKKGIVSLNCTSLETFGERSL